MVSMAMTKTLPWRVLRSIFMWLLSGACVAQKRVAVDGRPGDWPWTGQVSKPWRKSDAAAHARSQVLRGDGEGRNVRRDSGRCIAGRCTPRVGYYNAAAEVTSILGISDRYSSGAVAHSPIRQRWRRWITGGIVIDRNG